MGGRGGGGGGRGRGCVSRDLDGDRQREVFRCWGQD